MYSGQTTNYNLPQYEPSDRPKYLTDFNTAMQNIDNNMKSIDNKFNENIITNFNVVDNSLDTLNLDEILSSNFIKNYNYIDLQSYEKNSGYVRLTNDIKKYQVIEHNDYVYIKVPLIFNKIYNATLTNFYHALGIIIIDDDENVVFSPTDNNIIETINCIFRTKENYKYAIINMKINGHNNDLFKYFYQLAYIENTNVLTKFNKSRLLNENDELFSKENWYLRYYDQTTPQISTNKGAKVIVYPITKGLKYIVNSTNFQLCAGLGICDNNLNISYISSNEHLQEKTNFKYTFIAEFDGFLILSNPTSSENGSAYVYDDFMDDYKINLEHLKIGFIGDSICAGNGYAGGYAKCLNEIYGLNYQNIGVSGGRIAVNSSGGGSFFICENIQNFDQNLNAICIEGGINDYYNETPLGTITSDFDDTIDNTTFIGALEKIFRECYNNYPTIPVFFLISHNATRCCYHQNDIGLTFLDYIDAIYKVCKKYGIHIINICQDINFNTGASNTLYNNYTSGDGLHPNEAGYKKFYVPSLVSYINNIINNIN